MVSFRPERSGVEESVSRSLDFARDDNLRGKSIPSAPTKPTATGICMGFLSVCPGVSGISCDNVRVKIFAFSSYFVLASTFGVPAWEYQSLNCSKSISEASAIHCAQSSIVTACPSKRSKYKSVARRYNSGPNKVWNMRITSAPFSYTVMV